MQDFLLNEALQTAAIKVAIKKRVLKSEHIINLFKTLHLCMLYFETTARLSPFFNIILT